MISWNMVAVVGVPGVGKTSLCKSAVKSLGCNYINYGDLMLEIARDKNLAKTDKEMFTLDMELQYNIWKETAHKINETKHVLVDLHGLDQSPEGYLFSLPLEIICPSTIIIIEASPENILFRRRNDFLKDRINDDFRSLTEHMKMLRISMSISSVILGNTVYLLQNDEINKSKKELINLLSF
ncbi:MAG: AAA family ATPase [Methanobacteriaceae archaeon]|nr:AAA family ATPase [Methanobacteriaceae archaeon]MDP3034527.1 AAA family ATPase [Methanobacteriaceae archaeon]MDP3485068.1 AAA family ATPase [Methanobacteriaceae archaeon]MDP3623880.1 AAA family ATPase [Methanobacteriaceae archaeon]